MPTPMERFLAKTRSKRDDEHWNWKGGISRNYQTGANRRQT